MNNNLFRKKISEDSKGESWDWLTAYVQISTWIKNGATTAECKEELRNLGMQSNPAQTLVNFTENVLKEKTYDAITEKCKEEGSLSSREITLIALYQLTQ